MGLTNQLITGGHHPVENMLRMGQFYVFQSSISHNSMMIRSIYEYL